MAGWRYTVYGEVYGELDIDVGATPPPVANTTRQSALQVRNEFL